MSKKHSIPIWLWVILFIWIMPFYSSAQTLITEKYIDSSVTIEGYIVDTSCAAHEQHSLTVYYQDTISRYDKNNGNKFVNIDDFMVRTDRAVETDSLGRFRFFLPIRLIGTYISVYYKTKYQIYYVASFTLTKSVQPIAVTVLEYRQHFNCFGGENVEYIVDGVKLHKEGWLDAKMDEVSITTYNHLEYVPAMFEGDSGSPLPPPSLLRIKE